MSEKETNNGLNGGLLKGDSHADGGIRAIVLTDNNRAIEVEGGEVIINKKSVKSNKTHDFNGKKLTNKQILSEINQEGGGVPIYETGGEFPQSKLKQGGQLAKPKQQNKKEIENAYYTAFPKYSKILRHFEHNNKLQTIGELQIGGMLLLYFGKQKEYELFEIKDITSFGIKVKNANKNFLYPHARIKQMHPIYFSPIKNTEIEKFKSGATISKNRFSARQEIDRNKIEVDSKTFQGRDVEFSQKTYEKILNEGYDKSEDPIIVWFDKKTGKYIVISGHSRWAASKILYYKGDKSLATMPVKIFNGNKHDAVLFATIKSNRSNDPESLVSDIKAYKSAVKEGWNRKTLLGYFHPETRLVLLRNLSHLNPNGLFLQYLGTDADTSFAHIKNHARWVGALRGAYPEMLTNKHETEMFNFFYRPKKGKPRAGSIKKGEFIKLIEKKVNIFSDKSEPLNLENYKPPKLPSGASKKINEYNAEIDYFISEYLHNLEIIISAKKQENERFLSSIQDRVAKKMIVENQVIEAENTPVFDLFAQPQEIKPTKEGLNQLAQPLCKMLKALPKKAKFGKIISTSKTKGITEVMYKGKKFWQGQTVYIFGKKDKILSMFTTNEVPFFILENAGRVNAADVVKELPYLVCEMYKNRQ